MLPFSVDLLGGEPLYEQVVYGVKKAIIARQLRPGDPFPSVRQLSLELRINPNTAQKAVAALQQAGLLKVIPGLGTVVTLPPEATAHERNHVLDGDVERLVVNAKRLSIGLRELQRAVAHTWKKLEKP